MDCCVENLLTHRTTGWYIENQHTWSTNLSFILTILQEHFVRTNPRSLDRLRLRLRKIHNFYLRRENSYHSHRLHPILCSLAAFKRSSFSCASPPLPTSFRSIMYATLTREIQLIPLILKYNSLYTIYRLVFCTEYKPEAPTKRMEGT